MRISILCDTYTGNSISAHTKKSKYTNLNTGYNYIGTKDVGFDNTIDYENGVKIPFNEEKFRYAYPEDILLCIEGGSAGRKIAILSQKVCFGNKLCNFHQYVNQARYLYYLLQSPYFFGIFKENISGIIGGVSINKIKELIIPLPPIQEQKRIVSKIEALEPFIEEYGKAETELTALNNNFPEQIKKSILQYAIQGKLVEQDPNDEPASVLLEKIKAEKAELVKQGKIKKDKQESYIYKTPDNRHYGDDKNHYTYFEQIGSEIKDITAEIPFDIPDSWEWVRLGNVINYGETKAVTYSECDKNQWILDLEDIEKDTSRILCKNRIKDKPFKSTKKTFIKGDVLYSKLRPYLNKVVVADEDGVCTSEILPFRIYYGIVPEYLQCCLKSHYFYEYVNQLTYGVKMPRLGTEDGKKGLIPLPPIQEQCRIMRTLSKMLEFTNQL